MKGWMINMERIKWKEYFMAQSHLLSLRSTCERLSVGATIVKDNRVIAGDTMGLFQVKNIVLIMDV